MRKVINGRTYNTETSKQIGKWSNDLGYRDFRFCEETLYKNTKGAYFIHGEGGARSKYGTQTGSSTWSGGTNIIPMTAEEAQEWAEEHLTADEYEAEFGVQEEAGPSGLVNRERVGIALDNDVIKRLREHSERTGIPMARTIDKAVTMFLDAEEKSNV